KAMAELTKGAQGADLAEFEAKTGMKLTDIERVTVVVADADKSLWWGLVTSSKAFNREKLLAAFPVKPEKVQHAGKELEVITSPSGERNAVLFISDTLMAAGPEEGVKRAATLLGGKRPTGPLDDAIKRAREKHLLFVAVAPPAALMQKARKDMPPNAAA